VQDIQTIEKVFDAFSIHRADGRLSDKLVSSVGCIFAREEFLILSAERVDESLIRVVERGVLTSEARMCHKTIVADAIE